VNLIIKNTGVYMVCLPHNRM